MKKPLFILVILLAAGLAKAQSIVTEFNYGNGKFLNIHNIVETSDGCLLVECPMFESASAGPDIGDMFYKVTEEGVVIDSLLIENDDVNLWTLFERDPNNPDNYLHAYFDMKTDSVILRMFYMDNMLNFTDTKDVVLYHPVQSHYRHYDHFIDPCGDIIASFGDDIDGQYKVFFARIGFDGTVKHMKEVPEIIYFNRLQSCHTGMYNNSPLQYCYWGSQNKIDMYENPPIRCYVLDSLFNVVDEPCYYVFQGHTYLRGWQEHFTPLDSGHYLLATRYWNTDSNYYTHNWALLVKFDRNHEIQQSRLLGEVVGGDIRPIRAKAADDNTIYYSFIIKHDNMISELVLARMDNDLNVLWERYCKYDGDYWGIPMRVLENGNIAIGSFRYGITPGLVSVVIIKDDYDALKEQGLSVRPYTYYPNPVQDELHLQYSPDVTPKQIELYDLQGRLVKTQRNGLESLNMEGLSVGTYTMRVTLEGGKVFSDKVVK